MLSFFLFLLFLQSHAKSHTVPKNIILLAGQSNMAGRGGVVNNTKTHTARWDGIVPPQSASNPSIFRLAANGLWVIAHEPLHIDIDYKKVTGIGPGMAFANAVLTKDPNFRTIGLVPCAVGGTNIIEWSKGGSLYEQLVGRARAAGRSGGDIKVLLWYQGESDTIEMEDALAYKVRLERLFKDLREDLQFPMLPIIQVALASGMGPYISIVREAQLHTNATNVKCIDAMGLPLEPDRLHLTTAAQVQLGQRFANVFLHSKPTTMRITSGSQSLFSNFVIFVAPIFVFLVGTTEL